MRFSTSSFLLASAAGLTLAHKPLTPDAIEGEILVDNLRRTLQALDRIAKQNGGNRAFGTSGYKASVDFVLERAQTRFGKKFNTYLQPFNATFDQTLDIWVRGPDGEDVHVLSPLYNPPTPLPGGITASLLNTPVDDVNGPMCLPEQWEGIDATGKLVLVKRGVCAVSEKLKLARAHGALGMILYNQTPGKDYGTLTLGAENIGQLIPIGIIPLEDATGWIARLDAGEDVAVTLLVDSISEERETWNVISETKTGDPNNVVMLGAHLDSVIEGPGINDDGSGTAALLEIMEAVEKYDNFPNKIRFGWWAAEEAGLIGSLYYTEHLTEEEKNKIKLYFNYDMIASINPYFEISATENAGVLPQLLEDYIVSKGKEVIYDVFDGRSDYAGFVELGIPTASLFTGDGAPWDPCYHLACDDISNIGWEGFEINVKAAARAIAVVANSLEGVPAHLDASPNLRGRAKMHEQFRKWKRLAEHASHGQTCSHRKANVV